jgi:MFS family permease
MMMSQRTFWTLCLSAAAILAVTMGIRQSMGLFVSPLNSATGVGIVNLSLALAIGQFVWGLAQPIAGAVADKAGSRNVLWFGVLLLAAGMAAVPFVDSTLMLIFLLGVVTAAGSGAASFSILIGAIAQRLPAQRRAFASGFINAGGSFGQFVFAPLTQALITAFGWMTAMWSLAVAALVALPLAWPFRSSPPPAQAAGTVLPGTPAAADITSMTLRQQMRVAFRDRSYWCLHAGFFTCGFHIAFLVTHLPGEVALCSLPASVSAASLAIIGLFNIAGSLTAGALGNTFRMKHLLFWMYFARAIAIGLFLMAPKTPWTFYAFAAVLGFTWLATVPPTAGIVTKLFGPRYLATLFGMTLLSHQIGGFFGAYLGGIAISQTGSYNWMWYADMALALAAAFVNLPIRERHPREPAAAAA